MSARPVPCGQREDALHESLSETGDAEDGGAVVILHGAGNDLRSAGRFLIHQDRQFETVRRGDGGHGFGGLRHVAAAHGDDLHSGLQEQRGHLHRRGQHAAGVVAQIDHQAGQTVASQFLDGRFHFLRGLLVEAVDADVADAGADEEGAVHAGRLHFLRRQREVQQARNAGTPHVQPRLPLARLFQELRQAARYRVAR